MTDEPAAPDSQEWQIGRAGHGVSIPVHERIDVVVDQCRNFETFAPDSVIMLHVSMTATFEVAALDQALNAAGCRRTMINPVRIATQWGSILAAHLANVRALADVCAPNATISLNASNDMMLRSLTGEDATQPRFEQRKIEPTSVWFTGRQFARSPAFFALLHELGCRRAIGSQIEGSSYPLATLLRLADRMELQRQLVVDMPSVAEEVVFPTWGLQQLGTPRARPFILFRPSLLVGAAGVATPRFLRNGYIVDTAQKAANRVGTRMFSPDAAARDIAAIAAGRQLVATGWPNGASDTGPIVFHGIKRIARRYDDPLRERIRKVTEAEHARQNGKA